MSDLTPAFVRIRTQKAQSEDWAFCLHSVGWLMGLEPTTTGITILDSTN
jgi:hypothetical protein